MSSKVTHQDSAIPHRRPGAAENADNSLTKTRGLHGLLAAAGAVAILMNAVAATAAPGRIMQGLLISGGTIVDTRTGKLIRGRTIIINDGKITKIVRSGSVVAAGGARAINASGKFIIPGLLEMHAHPLMSADTKGHCP